MNTTPHSNLMQPVDQTEFPSPEFMKTANPMMVGHPNYLNSNYNMLYMQMQQQQRQNGFIEGYSNNSEVGNIGKKTYPFPGLVTPQAQPTIHQTNYINNVNIYPPYSNQPPYTSLGPSSINNSKENYINRITPKVETGASKLNHPDPSSKISPDIYSRIISNQEYNPYIPSSLNSKKKGQTPIISDLYDSNCFLNTNTAGQDVPNIDKKSSSIEDIFSIQKRIERMSLNENYNLNDLMVNNEFVNYVYNYRFSVNDKDDINSHMSKYSQNQRMDSYSSIGNQIVNPRNKQEEKLSKTENENEEAEQDEIANAFNYNNYYNSLFGNNNSSD